MEQESSFTGREVVSVAAAAAGALGGIIVALGRAQQGAAQARQLAAERARREEAALLAQRAREAARAATSALAERYPEVRESVAQRAAHLATPDLARIGDLAGERAARLREASLGTLERLQETAVPAVADAVSAIAHRASEALPESPPEPPVVQVAAERAGAVAKSAGSGARELLATIVWLVAAGAVVYGLLLSEERRRQLSAAIAGAIEQAQLLISDFAGYEDDF